MAQKEMLNLFREISNPKLAGASSATQANFSVNGRDYSVGMSFATTESLPKGLKLAKLIWELCFARF